MDKTVFGPSYAFYAYRPCNQELELVVFLNTNKILGWFHLTPGVRLLVKGWGGAAYMLNVGEGLQVSHSVVLLL